MTRLRRSDLPPDTELLARALLGVELIRRFDDGTLAAGRIVETEAYAPGDPSSHAVSGPTARNRSMFLRHLHAYVYLIYGTYFCLNISSDGEQVGAAVLVRALAPLTGLDAMRARRGQNVRDRDLLRGPGRVCAALEIDRRLDGIDLDVDERLWLRAPAGEPAPVAVSVRIGLSKAVDVPHRFYIPGDPHVSGRRSLSPECAPPRRRRAGIAPSVVDVV